MVDADFGRVLEAVDFTTTWPKDFNEIQARDTFAKILALNHIDYTSKVASLLGQYSWLNEFSGYSSTFIQSRSFLEQDTNALCQILHSYVKMVAGKLAQATELRYSQFHSGWSSGTRVHYGMKQDVTEIKTFTKFNERIKYYYNSENRGGLKQIRDTLALYGSVVQRGEPWSQLCGNINMFCEQLGGTAEPYNPLQSIAKLRELQKGSELVKELQDKIKQLNGDLERKNEELGKHRRIIACLTFRRVLEQLPEHPNKRWDYTVDWANFWMPAMEAADKNPDHPLRPVLKQFGEKPGFDRIHEIGESLYEDMSTDIHHFNGGGFYEVREDIWSAPQCAILRVLIPKAEDVDKDGTINWEKWRHRFLPHKSDSDTSEDDIYGDEDNSDVEENEGGHDDDDDDSDSDGLSRDIGKLNKNMSLALTDAPKVQ
jgi:hypothetical protein